MHRCIGSADQLSDIQQGTVVVSFVHQHVHERLGEGGGGNSGVEWGRGGGYARPNPGGGGG